jgi:predicted metal-binding protein
MDMTFDSLIQHALTSGASGAVLIEARNIIVDDSLADKCREPRCENYGLSKRCPPNTGGPPQMRKRLKKYERALFFRIDVPSEVLYSSDAREVFQFLHELTVGIETKARQMGWTSALGYAGGSCKKLFCSDQTECLALANGQCRHPHHARPSMSGYGINVAGLFDLVGWDMNGVSGPPDMGGNKIASVSGLILLH